MEGSLIKLIDLPIELLVQIFGNIPELRDKINLAQSHPSLEDVFSIHFPTLLKDGEWCPNLSHDDFGICVKLCGAKIKKLNFYYCYDQRWTTAAKFCPNLEELRLEIFNRCSFEELLNSLKPMQHLKKLRLRFVYCDNLLFFVSVKPLSVLPNLKALSLFFDSSCTQVKDLNFLHQLEELELTMTKKLDFYTVISLPKLRHLYMKRFSFSGQINLNESWSNLESLHIFSVDGVELPYFPKLKCLKIESIFQTLDTILRHTISKYGKHIEKLAVRYHFLNVHEAELIGKHFECLRSLECGLDNVKCLRFIGQLTTLESLILRNPRNLTVQFIILLLQRCTKLRHLELFKCFKIEPKDAFAAKLTKTLIDIGVNSNDKMILVVAKDNYDILKDELESLGQSSVLTIRQASN